MVLAVQRGLEEQTFAMLWLVSYVFLLRLPSEACLRFMGCGLQFPILVVVMCLQALPLCKMRPDSPGADNEQTIIWLEGDTVCLRIRRRKNLPRGSGILKRKCSCQGGTNSCAVHTLWHKFLAELPEGARPFAHISAGMARKRLRQILTSLRVPNAQAYGTHDFRRGHADVSLRLRDVGTLVCIVLSALVLRRAGYEGVRLHIGRDIGRRPMEVQGLPCLPGRGMSVSWCCLLRCRLYLVQAELEKEVAFLVATDSDQEEEWID